MNYCVIKLMYYDVLLKLKDLFWFYVGFCCECVGLVYNIDNFGDKYKFERFLRVRSSMIVSVYVFIMYGLVFVIGFKELFILYGIKVDFCFMGFVCDVNLDRIVFK